MASPPSTIDLEQELRRIGRSAQQILRRQRQSQLLKRSANLGLLLIPLGPAALLLWMAIANSSATTRVTATPLVWVVATLGPPLIWAIVTISRCFSIQVDRRDALAWVDRTYDLEDRLVTGDEFLKLDSTNPFVLASIEDAASVAKDTTTVQLPTRISPWSLSRLAVAAPFAAILLILASLLIHPSEPQASGGQSPTVRAAEPSGVTSDKKKGKKKTPNAAKKKSSVKETEEKVDEKTTPGATRKQQPNPQKLSDLIKETSGKTEAGQSADAASASGASQSKGVPSRESQTSKSDPTQPRKKKRKKKKKPSAKQSKSRKKPTNEPSGSTSGRGSSGGSSRNPVSTPWSSKDKVAEVEQDADANDDDVDDEESKSEARGGVQPNLRDRRPPVSRDLTIGFGNRSNPDANGRGGPGQQKKSRGTASLVLGVPIPDQIKGQPNPGKTKITQERVEPKAEDSPTALAQERQIRTDPFGFVPRQNLEPWMRDLIRKYFLSIRSASEKKPTT